MHGRVKSVEREKEEQKTDEQREEELSKVRMYHEVAGKILHMKRQHFYEPSVLPLTSHLLLLNPEFHVLWSFRREAIDALVPTATDPKAEMHQVAKNELKLTLDALQRNPKSYSAWFQRKWVIDRGMGDLAKEIQLCDKLLDLDERNFHCWNYRRHVCQLAGVSATARRAFTMQKIEQNFSNYSALHDRSILLPRPFTPDGLFEEIRLIQQAVFTEPDDQSAWFYYRWLVTSMVELVASCPEDTAGFLKSQIVWLQELLEMENEAKWVVVTLANLHYRLSTIVTVSGWEEAKTQCAKLYDRASIVDPDHRHYYDDMKKKCS